MSPTALEQSFADICEKHGLTSVSVGMSLKQSKDARFDVGVHWDGFCRSGISCTTGHGPTVAAALTEALAEARSDREPFSSGVAFADEALPEGSKAHG